MISENQLRVLGEVISRAPATLAEQMVITQTFEELERMIREEQSDLDPPDEEQK